MDWGNRAGDSNPGHSASPYARVEDLHADVVANMRYMRWQNNIKNDLARGDEHIFVFVMHPVHYEDLFQIDLIEAEAEASREDDQSSDGISSDGSKVSRKRKPWWLIHWDRILAKFLLFLTVAVQYWSQGAVLIITTPGLPELIITRPAGQSAADASGIY
ncbi:hypothetical protein BV25DRAFT_1843481 [Artomyces pyxidatus]|uniref:Uncharacterized protein n=1 Tax=Artomyces pyxidatus TaxID=48021 RepID=A0ACB8SEK5_9AGAM|nr:hypothetical protein BV25DRAFT_1843481 [Artomyces pyxidatus]